MKVKEFSKELAEIVGELNAVHPFLDGNGLAIVNEYRENLDILSRYVPLATMINYTSTWGRQTSHHLGDYSALADQSHIDAGYLKLMFDTAILPA